MSIFKRSLVQTIKFLLDTATDRFIEDPAFAFMSPNDLIEDNKMTVLSLTPTSCIKNATLTGKMTGIYLVSNKNTFIVISP